MNGRTPIRTAALAAALAASVAATPAPPAPPSTPPPAATTTAPADTKPQRTKFANGDPINDYFTAIAVRFGVMVVQAKPVDAFVLKDFDMPDKLQDALTIARQTLEPQGFSVLESVSSKRLVIRILPTKDAQKLELSESPVTYGTEGEKIDISNPERQVTHLLPIVHVDMVDTLRRAALQDAGVSADITGSGAIGVNLILTGPALRVQHAVETVAKLDKPVGGQIIARTLPLQHLDAQATADTLNEGFAQTEAPMKAVVDKRTNSIVITGPEQRVMELMVTLIGQDAKRGPILPRPEVQPVQKVPSPPILPVPGTTRPGARGNPGVEKLDENALGGDNARPGQRWAQQYPGNFSLIVNEGLFL